MMQKAFDKILEGLLPDGETALLAVSGGIDSICMADLFLNSSLHRPFAMAHCNFHLRGEESDSDERLVEEWAEKNGIKCHKADFDTEKYAREHSLSIEMAARELRYDWFASLCKEHGYYATAVAHNANDNAETLMLNLLRGTGLKGISGMKEMSTIAVSREELSGPRLIRPMLTFSREDICAHVRENGLVYHDDRTNAETVYKRNKIRHLVFPVFESMNPSFLQTFSREMRIFAQENSIAEDYFESARARVCTSPAGKDEMLRINVDALKDERHRDYVLFRLLEPFGFRAGGLEAISHLITDADTFSGKEFKTQAYRALTSDGCIIVKKDRSASFAGKTGRLMPGRDTIAENDVCTVIRGESRYVFGGTEIDVCTKPSEGIDPKTLARKLAEAGTLSADSSALTFPFLVRRWREGDWMRPIGVRGRKKLSDLFTDLKLDLDGKAEALVVVLPSLNKDLADGKNAGEHVAAVCGHVSGKFFCRVDEAVKADVSTSSLVCISIN